MCRRSCYRGRTEHVRGRCELLFSNARVRRIVVVLPVATRFVADRRLDYRWRHAGVVERPLGPERYATSLRVIRSVNQ
jgi:hypothetical protein